MASDIIQFHLKRLKAATIDAYNLDSLADWIVDNTRLIDGSRYSFKGREYQRRIASDTSQELVIRKCSQIGISEITARRAIALCSVIQPFNVILTHPSATAASDFMRDRITPVIAASPYVKAMVNNAVDNVTAKQIGISFLYLKGCGSDGAPLSVPADELVHDEVDASSQETMKLYQSRLTNSKYKRKTFLSTPTYPGFGIDKEFARTRRHYNFTKCDHCNHHFIPDFFKHVRIPGFTGDVREINAFNLQKYKWRDAYVECPNCGRIPDLSIEHREWVCENPNEDFVGAGYQVSPFDVPTVITPSFLVHASTQYGNYNHFINQNLGLPAEDKESTLTQEDLDKAIVPRGSWGTASVVMGLDMGATCWFTLLATLPNGQNIIVHTESCPLAQVVERKRALSLQYRTRMCVVDILPYTETVMRMQQQDPNCYAGAYSTWVGVDTHRVKSEEEDLEKGRFDIKQVTINRDLAFDQLMDDVRSGYIIKMTDDNDALWKRHLSDMKRVQLATRDGETKFTWKKNGSHGNDHYHHSLLYASIAAKMMGVSGNLLVIPSFIGTFKVKREL